MTRRRLPNHLRTVRTSCALPPKKLALLLGLKHRNAVSRYELHARRPRLMTALACEVVFGKPVSRLFSRYFREVEEQVIARAYRLYQSVEHRDDDAGKKQARLLLAIVSRAKRRHKDHA